MSVADEIPSTQARTEEASVNQPSHRRGLSGRTAWLILAAHLPFVLLHFSQLWHQRPHYEFFPFVLVASIWMIVARWPQPAQVRHTKVSTTFGWVLLIAGLASQSGSILFFSPSLGTAAAILSLGGLLLLRTGQAAFRLLAAPWCLLWLLIPPPFSLDLQFIHWLQSTTARLASWALEYRHIEHVLSGHVFELPGRELFVSEACSGVHSQFVLVAACLILTVLTHRTLIHGMLLVTAAVFWSIVANTTRVAIVVGVLARHNIDLTEGWRHELLGYALVLGGFLMLLATDTCLRGLFAPFDNLVLQSHPWAKAWNRWISGVRPESSPTPSSLASEETFPQAEIAPFATGRLRVVCGVFLALTVLQTAVLVAEDVHLKSKLTDLHREITDQWIPPVVDDWKQTGYTTQQRDRGSEFGEHSNVWRFTSSGREAIFSIDHTFFGWHELSHCYEGRGWNTKTRTTVRLDGDDKFVSVDLISPTGEYGLLMFVIFDAQGQPLDVISQSWAQDLGYRFANSRLLGMLEGKGRWFQASRVEGVQAQLFATSAVPFSTSQRDELRQLFLQLQRHARDRIAKRAGSEAAVSFVEKP